MYLIFFLSRFIHLFYFDMQLRKIGIEIDVRHFYLSIYLSMPVCVWCRQMAG